LNGKLALGKKFIVIISEGEHRRVVVSLFEIKFAKVIHLNQWFSTKIAPRAVYLKKKFPRLRIFLANLSALSHTK